MSQETLLIRGGYYYHPSARFIKGDILIDKGKIRQIGSGLKMDCKTIQLEGEKIIPGFIDVHIQGAGGCDCMEGSQQALNTISGTLAREGTTSFLATTIMMPGEKNTHLPIINKAAKEPLEGAQLLGIHLEGPFINPIKKGGIIPAAIGKPSSELFQKVLSLCGDSLKMMTIAPEIEGNREIIRALKDKGIIAAFGHSDADYEQTRLGIDTGINHVTHLFNAMRPLHHREPGSLAALFESAEISAQIISDGQHIHPSVVKLAYRLLGKERCILITDGMSGLGLGDGHYEYIGQKYISENGTSRYPNGTLNGTTIGLLSLSERFCHFTGCTFEEVLPMGTLIPARLLGIDKSKGSIEEGKDADLVILDKENRVITTIAGGQIVYANRR